MLKTAKFWDKIAEKYSKSPIADEKSYQYTLGRTRSYLAATDHILEIGCGTGSTALLLAGDVAQITATDLSINMIKIATQKSTDQDVSNVKFEQAELFDVSLKGVANEQAFDVVLAFSLVHLLEDTAGGLLHINSLLKPGGKFISKTVCMSDKGLPIQFKLIKFLLPILQMIGKAPFVRGMKAKDLENEIEAAGFRILEKGNYPANRPAFYIVAEKI